MFHGHLPRIPYGTGQLASCSSPDNIYVEAQWEGDGVGDAARGKGDWCCGHNDCRQMVVDTGQEQAQIGNAVVIYHMGRQTPKLIT